MNRKKKIIYITLLFVVLVSIIGFTFAYIGTKILGNSNSKKMSFTAKKVSVTYKEISNTSSGETISPGYQYLKIFTATNTGNVEVKYHIYLDEVENNFIRVQDITYTLYRKSGNNTITSSNLSSAEVIANGTFPIINQYIKTDEVLTKPNDVYTYALKINYNTSTESQDSDSGHVFGFKVQLHTNKDETYGENTLAYNVIKNAIGVTDTQEKAGTAKYRPTPTTVVAESTSNSTEADLSQTVDDYGKTFYFRGNVKNNYIDFAGRCWRIVRIQGDGSVKLILEDLDSTCANSNGDWKLSNYKGTYGVNVYEIGELADSNGNTNTVRTFLKNYLNGDSDSSIAKLFETFQTTLSSDIDSFSYLKAGNWCLNDKAFATYTDNLNALTSNEIRIKQVSGTTFYYDSFVRLSGKAVKEPTLKCNGGMLDKFVDNTDMYVATLTADEMVFAGATTQSTNNNFYLINNTQYRNEYYFHALSLSHFRLYRNDYEDMIFLLTNRGLLKDDGYTITDGLEVRPSIQLLKGIVLKSGTGTQTDPYVIE